jgi:hypothetical protein
VAFTTAYLFASWNNGYMLGLSESYSDNVAYYGKMATKAAVMLDKQKFMERWPNRNYKIRLDSTSVACDGSDVELGPCIIQGVVDWEATNQAKRSVGAANFSYTFAHQPGGRWIKASPPLLDELLDLRIVAENSTVIDRQVTALATATTAPAQAAKSLSPDEVAMVAATVFVGGKECGIKGNGYPLPLAIAKLGQDLVDFYPDGRYAPLVEVKIKKGLEFINGMGKAKGCEGIQETLIKFLPDIYAQK